MAKVMFQVSRSWNVFLSPCYAKVLSNPSTVEICHQQGREEEAFPMCSADTDTAFVGRTQTHLSLVYFHLYSQA